MKLNKTDHIALLSILLRLEAAGELMRHVQPGPLKPLVDKIEPKVATIVDYIKRETQQ